MRRSRILTRVLKAAFTRETELFLETIIREDRSVLEVADGRLHVRQ